MDVIFGAVSHEARQADINRAAHGNVPHLTRVYPDVNLVSFNTALDGQDDTSSSEHKVGSIQHIA